MDYETIAETTAFLQATLGPLPDVAVILGSGLGDFAEGLADATSWPYDTVPHWPTSAVVGHAGRMVVGRVGDRRVLALSGRSHFYEGHSMDRTTFATRVLGHLGIKVLIVTNAAGGINRRFSSGALMIIDDHLNFMGTNPLVGANDARFGPRFPDMSEVYSARLRGLAGDVAQEMGLALERGVYVAVHGPSYETPAEIRAFRALGADAVGMSTVPEAIVARHMGLEVLGLSCITNMAAGVLPQPLVHDEVMATARRVRGGFIALLEGIIGRL
ncbi:MAG: purine-nucleoside phosphorylase [Acidobacteria bacterium]|jgi:purine-nucleoside phosphorylase|nr:purine-nucleoside phosphorylase [Acidobacteriota bacterium]